jgi:hypothetical protein
VIFLLFSAWFSWIFPRSFSKNDRPHDRGFWVQRSRGHGNDFFPWIFKRCERHQSGHGCLHNSGSDLDYMSDKLEIPYMRPRITGHLIFLFYYICSLKMIRKKGRINLDYLLQGIEGMIELNLKEKYREA